MGSGLGLGSGLGVMVRVGVGVYAGTLVPPGSASRPENALCLYPHKCGCTIKVFPPLFFPSPLDLD